MAGDRTHLLDMFRRIVEGAKPEPDFIVGPLDGEVLAQNRVDGVSTVDVRILKSNGEPDEAWETLSGIQVPTIMGTGADAVGTIFAIEPGTPVLIGFIRGEKSRPYLDSVFSNQVPDATGIYWLIKTRNTGVGVTNDRRFFVNVEDAAADITLNLAGLKIKMEAGVISLGEGADESLVLGNEFITDYLTHTHPTPAGPSSAPTTIKTIVDYVSAVAKTLKGGP